MPNMLDYCDWRSDLALSVAPFNPVDNLILCELAYRDYAGSVGREGRASIAQASRAAGKNGDEKDALFAKVGASARFGAALLTDFVDEINIDEEKQFSAITAHLSDGSVFIAYRGTDNTLVGWKEDFNLAFSDFVPAQREAAEYLNRIAAKYEKPIRVGGHSKGGNLAIYAAAFCETKHQSRILSVYSNDGPGQSEKTIQSVEYARIRDRLRVFVPQSSIVGMLLEHDRDYTIVKSDARGGVFQHNPFTWQTRATGFETVKRVTASSRYLDSTISQWLHDMSKDERRRFADALYTLLSAGNAKTITQLSANWTTTVPAILYSAIGYNRESARMLGDVAKSFLSVAMREAGEMVRFELLNPDGDPHDGE